MKKAIYTLLFPLAAYLLLLTQADYLHAVAENDLFISGQAFFEETIRTQGGLWTWLGCYFTQFFTYPWLGAMIIVAIWTATYFLLVDAFRLKGWHSLLAWIPVCLIGFGYRYRLLDVLHQDAGLLVLTEYQFLHSSPRHMDYCTAYQDCLEERYCLVHLHLGILCDVSTIP